MINSIIYPNPSFTPEIRMYDGVEFAHAGKTPFWCSKEGIILIEDELQQLRPAKVYHMQQRARYNTRTVNGVIIGPRYPDVTDRRKHYLTHRLMALAWIEPIPAGYQVDHINGDIYNWMLDNVRIVSVQENYRSATILRWLRSKGIDPRYLTGLQCRIAFSVVPLWDKDRRTSISQHEILVILTSYTIVNPQNID